MPNYVFYCRRDKRTFTALMSVKEHDDRVAECPECHKTDEVERQIAPVYVVTSKKS